MRRGLRWRTLPVLLSKDGVQRLSLPAVLGTTGRGQLLSAESCSGVGKADYARHQQPDAYYDTEPQHQALPPPQSFAEPQSEHRHGVIPLLSLAPVAAFLCPRMSKPAGGTVGISVGTVLPGYYRLQLFDSEKGQARAVLLLRDGRPSLELARGDGTDLATVLETPGGGPELSLADKSGGKRIRLSVEAAGEAALGLDGDHWEPRAVLGYTELEDPRTGSEVKRPPSSLVLLGKDGKVIWHAP